MIFAALTLWSVLAGGPAQPSLQVTARSVPGSPFEEIHVSTSTAVAPGRVCDAIWDRDGRTLEPGFKKRQTLKETRDERWTYEQISEALVEDRDYTMHVRRVTQPGGGCQVTFDTENDKGPPPQRGFVRIPVIRGWWEVAPTPEGSRVDYVIYANPGGSIPAFLTRGPQRSSAVAWMRKILARTARGH